MLTQCIAIIKYSIVENEMTIADVVLFCCFATLFYDSDINWFWYRAWFQVVAWGGSSAIGSMELKHPAFVLSLAKNYSNNSQAMVTSQMSEIFSNGIFCLSYSRRGAEFDI